MAPCSVSDQNHMYRLRCHKNKDTCSLNDKETTYSTNKQVSE